MNQKVFEIIRSAIEELNADWNNPALNSISGATMLYGKEGTLDSLSLVKLIALLEEKVAYAFQKDIMLADEKAMSQQNSPFRTVQNLTDYIAELVK